MIVTKEQAVGLNATLGVDLTNWDEVYLAFETISKWLVVNHEAGVDMTQETFKEWIEFKRFLENVQLFLEGVRPRKIKVHESTA